MHVLDHFLVHIHRQTILCPSPNWLFFFCNNWFTENMQETKEYRGMRSSVWAHCTPRCAERSQRGPHKGDSGISAVSLTPRLGLFCWLSAGIWRTTPPLPRLKGLSQPCSKRSRVQEQSYCSQFGTFLGPFLQGDSIIKAILCLSRSFAVHKSLTFTPETFDQKCAQWLWTGPSAPRGLWCYRLCQHCHKIAGLKMRRVQQRRALLSWSSPGRA